MLNGAYYIRQVLYVIQTQQSPEGTVGEAINMQGTITFDGKGNYSFSGSLLDSGSGSLTPQTGVATTGTYVISASGMGYITAINPEVSGDLIVGLVSNGIFIGSSTQNSGGYNDLTIAAPIGSTATNATLKGSYQVAYFDPTVPADATFGMNADGSGNVGTINATEYIQAATSPTGQTLTGVHYAFSNGAAQFTFSNTVSSTQLLSGTELLYISPDGNFIFGGSYNGFDMFVGVRNATSNPTNYDGLYYQAGLDMDIVSEGVLLDSYYGAINAFSGNIIGHQNVNSQLVYGGASDFTYYDHYTLNGDGSSTDQEYSQQYWSSADGSIRIGYGVPSSTTGFDELAINVALKAPTLTGNGVYLSPQGVVNAASSAPFTAHLSPGRIYHAVRLRSGAQRRQRLGSLPQQVERSAGNDQRPRGSHLLCHSHSDFGDRSVLDRIHRANSSNQRYRQLQCRHPVRRSHFSRRFHRRSGWRHRLCSRPAPRLFLDHPR